MLFKNTLEPDDWPNVDALLRGTYPTEFEAHLIDRLRGRGQLAAEHSLWHQGALVAYIAYSPVTVEHGHEDRTFWGLGPLAVDPEYQNEGLAVKLMTESFEETHADALFVLGHVGFYAKIGFHPAAEFGLSYDDNSAVQTAFMAMECWKDALKDIHGRVFFDPAFAEG
ncbi:GNAT family N-acetyltransferase [Kordiimonas marina]|uniref:GNAT family N-acetyltransferase n=1 Tax=Kordiimonas marina TaxID=2872312 RepID=UPI001FF36670|nr:N-acetyltransferase [Kordiimonas marina]MCJ9429218.1 N-acetyltransferase [Kordiimonas marina]